MNKETVIRALRRLYDRYGYTPYKMRKFEDYELYVRNKDFLISENVITFNDVGGRLLALKPDVTLSIVKNTDCHPGQVQKVYYNENVYRVSARTRRFGEITQAGIECIGDLDAYCVSEVLYLAAESLRTVSEQAVLDISHLGVLSALLDTLTEEKALRSALIHCVGEKNTHELTALCREKGIAEEKVAPLCALITTYGAPREALPKLMDALAGQIDPALLEELAQAVFSLPEALQNMIRIDFSVVSNLKYYNGIVFQGFVPGVPGSVLSGGRYDPLLRKLGRKGQAIGFAVYMDELECLWDADAYDVDMLLLYDSNTAPEKIRAAVEMLSAEGSVSAQRLRPEKLRFGKLMQLRQDGEVIRIADHA